MESRTNKGNESCVETYVAEHGSPNHTGHNANAGWNDAGCQDEIVFVCESGTICYNCVLSDVLSDVPDT